MPHRSFCPVRTLLTCRAQVSYHRIVGDPLSWLCQQAQPDDILLVTQTDGVIWGVPTEATGWATSSDIPNSGSPASNAELVWEARLFNARREVLVWRDNSHWQARTIADEVNADLNSAPPDFCEYDFCEYYDEHYLLWGTTGVTAQTKGAGFLIVCEGAQGIRHAPPSSDPNLNVSAARRLCLRVRHYLAPDEIARTVATRLVELTVCEEEEQA